MPGAVDQVVLAAEDTSGVRGDFGWDAFSLVASCVAEETEGAADVLVALSAEE